MIDKVTQERIKDAADIVDIVGDYVRLIRSGANYKALCPFHNERTPSFSINRQRNFCYCFSCKKGGSPVNFLMQKEGYTYEEALRHLARRYGIQIEEKELSSEEKEAMHAREAMLAANEWAMKKMESDLFDTEEGRNVGLEYFRYRGVSDEAIRAFHLGYALDSGNSLTEAARKAGFNLEYLRETGLIGESQHGTLYDRYRGRVIFPFISQSRKVVGFGGRTLKKDDPRKYLNSSDSVVYKKSRLLYGISQAKESIIKEDKSFLVEGYMDVIGMWQAGMRNVVASSGTALTDGQISLLKRYSSKITLIYDGDAAGIKAALRGIDMLLAQGMNTKVLLLPDGDDPDSFARKHTAEEFRDYVDKHETDIITFKARVLLGDSANDPVKLGDAVRSVVTSIAQIPDHIQRYIYIRECARVMNMPEESIASAVAQARGRVELDNRNRREREQAISGAKIINETARAVTTRNPVAPVSNVPSDVNNVGCSNPLYPLERAVMAYLVKYGMLVAGTVEDEEHNISEVKVWEYTKSELENDEMSFGDRVFAKLWERIQNLAAEFPERWENMAGKIENEIAGLRKQGYDEISGKNLDMASIEAEERMLEQRLADFREQQAKHYARCYIERNLYDDEDNEIRTLVNSFMMEPYQLSNIYLKNGNTENDEDKLEVIIPRAILEWKNEWLELRLKRICAELDGCDDEDDETVRRLQIEISDIIAIRSELAKRTGDRILVPLSRWNEKK